MLEFNITIEVSIVIQNETQVIKFHIEITIYNYDIHIIVLSRWLLCLYFIWYVDLGWLWLWCRKVIKCASVNNDESIQFNNEVF
jgi:hypothetical protein